MEYLAENGHEAAHGLQEFVGGGLQMRSRQGREVGEAGRLLCSWFCLSRRYSFVYFCSFLDCSCLQLVFYFVGEHLGPQVVLVFYFGGEGTEEIVACRRGIEH